MKNYLKPILIKAIPILITAALAAGITFLQSVLTQTNACNVPVEQMQEAGFIGALLKIGHSGVLALRNTLRV